VWREKPILLLALALVTSACFPWDREAPATTITRTVERGDADSASVQVRMGAGRLDVSGGANTLLDAEFIYSNERWKPEVLYEGRSGRGTLTVQQPSIKEIELSTRERYEWKLRPGNQVPLDMNVAMGVGDSTLHLRDLNLKTLDVKSGAGNLTCDAPPQSLTRLTLTAGAGNASLDLSGAWQNNLDATIRGGVGKLTLRLPRQTGVRVKVVGALGKVNANGFRIQDDAYVNDAYATSAIRLRILVAAAVGAVDLVLVP